MSEKKGTISDEKDASGVEQKNTEFVRPPFEPLKDLKNAIQFILFDPKANFVVILLLVMMESMALKVIINKVAYTEIDYKAYVEQIEMIKNGEYDYSKIEGGTGPLVYPAGHVLIYRFMNYMTSGMEYISEGQVIFRVLYMITLIPQMLIYYMMELPPWCIILACLSKRLHSIYVLRLFNDCFTTFFIVITVLMLTTGSRVANPLITKILTVTAAITYSFAISIKMNALLYLPSILIAFYLNYEGKMLNVVFNMILMLLLQIIVALPFLKTFPKEYLNGAFDFSRQFMYQWSINWQMLDEEGFQNKYFHLSLLISQIVCIMTVILCQYPLLIQDLLKSTLHPLTKNKLLHSHTNTKLFIPFTMIITNFIGIIFSRSLHYQFLTWYHWTIPLMISWSKLSIYCGIPWYIAHEYCWNSYPPNTSVSILLFSLNIILLLLMVIFQVCNCDQLNNFDNSKEAEKKKNI